MSTADPRSCPRCGAANLAVARYCAQCGLTLGAGGAPGRIPHPDPAHTPPGFIPCEDSSHLYFRSESAHGGPALIDTEGVRVTIFNAGFSLREVQFEVAGEGRDGAKLFAESFTAEQLPQGASTVLEIPSYLVSEPLRRLRVRLVAAAFTPPDGAAPSASVRS